MPFGEGLDAGKGETEWIVARDKPSTDEIFNSLEQHKGKITGTFCFSFYFYFYFYLSFSFYFSVSFSFSVSLYLLLLLGTIGRVARDELLKSKLTNNTLGKIWRLADTDQVEN
jgi:hypothetical protein